jgi:hypothetical protein
MESGEVRLLSITLSTTGHPPIIARHCCEESDRKDWNGNCIVKSSIAEDAN